MCGISGFIYSDEVSLGDALSYHENLLNRGYDSVGCCYNDGFKYSIIKSSGDSTQFRNRFKDLLLNRSNLFLFHNRWSTHSKSDDISAHPHKFGNIILCHNGIIENYLEIKNSLIKKGYTFLTEVDSEVVAALIHYKYKSGGDTTIKDAIAEACSQLVGSYALVIVSEVTPGVIYAIRKDSPLLYGKSDKFAGFTSEISGFPSDCMYHNLTEERVYSISPFNLDTEGIHNVICNKYIKNQDKSISTNTYMESEITESISLINNIDFDFEQINFNYYNKVVILGCGSSYHLGLLGKSVSKIGSKLEVHLASEFTYTDEYYSSLFIYISQSGETADLIKVARKVNSDIRNNTTMAILNVENSSLSSLVNKVIYSKCGKEVSVATTKVYTIQAIILLKLLGVNINKSELSKLLVDKYSEFIKFCSKVVESMVGSKLILHLGTGVDNELAKEAALKMREVSYIHSFSLPIFELKHGTISLVDQDTTAIIYLSEPRYILGIISAINELLARDCDVILITSYEGISLQNPNFESIIVPREYTEFSIIIIFQLIALLIAESLKLNPDKPRNLAKTVTVL